MADLERGATEDFLRLVAPADVGVKLEVIEGPNTKETVDDLTQSNKATGEILQEDARRVKISGVEKVALLDASVTLPNGGEVWDRTTNDASAGDPNKVRIDDVNTEGQTEGGYKMYSISFHYFDDIASGKRTLTRTDMGL